LPLTWVFLKATRRCPVPGGGQAKHPTHADLHVKVRAQSQLELDKVPTVCRTLRGFRGAYSCLPALVARAMLATGVNPVA
jgi:hypothetical protein